MGRTWTIRAQEWTVVTGPQWSRLLPFMFLRSPPCIEWGWPSPSAGYWGNIVWLEKIGHETLQPLSCFPLDHSLCQAARWRCPFDPELRLPADNQPQLATYKCTSLEVAPSSHKKVFRWLQSGLMSTACSGTSMPEQSNLGHSWNPDLQKLYQSVLF